MNDFEAIEQGLERGEFFLEYLPTVDLESGRCVGAEALSRWRRPDRVVPPLEFLRVVENTPLAGMLTYWVIEQLARDFRDWLKVNDAFISFNVPPEIIGRGGILFAARASGLLEVSDRIVMEVTERGVPDRLAVEALHWRLDSLEMDERAMIGLYTAPYFLILPICFVGGLILGFAYFRALRWTADLIVGGGHPLLGLALTFGRLAFLGAGFYVAVLSGGLALLAVLAGVLCAKALMLRQTRSDSI